MLSPYGHLFLRWCSCVQRTDSLYRDVRLLLHCMLQSQLVHCQSCKFIFGLCNSSFSEANSTKMKKILYYTLIRLIFYSSLIVLTKNTNTRCIPHIRKRRGENLLLNFISIERLAIKKFCSSPRKIRKQNGICFATLFCFVIVDNQGVLNITCLGNDISCKGLLFFARLKYFSKCGGLHVLYYEAWLPICPQIYIYIYTNIYIYIYYIYIIYIYNIIFRQTLIWSFYVLLWLNPSALWWFEHSISQQMVLKNFPGPLRGWGRME